MTRAVVGNPYKGIGKPEALKYELAPKWSRRITKEHRFVYQVLDDKICVDEFQNLSCFGRILKPIG